jgi:hypothetical protein
MPRPKRTTLADHIRTMLAEGIRTPEIAKSLGTSVTYVQVIRARQRHAESGLKRNRLAERAPRQGRTRDPEILKAQKSRAGRALVEKRIYRPVLRSNEPVDLSILRRREYVNRILEAWKRADGQETRS